MRLIIGVTIVKTTKCIACNKSIKLNILGIAYYKMQDEYVCRKCKREVPYYRIYKRGYHFMLEYCKKHPEACDRLEVVKDSNMSGKYSPFSGFGSTHFSIFSLW